MTDILSQMVIAASLAPSIHNSQPWTFRVDGDRGELAVMTQSAEAAELADERYRKELEAWTRTENEAEDGIPLSCLPVRGAVSRAADVPVRDYHPSITVPEHVLEAEGPPAA